MAEATGRFRRSDRLLDSRDYRRVMRRGKRRANGNLVVISAPKRQNPRKNGDLRPSREGGQGRREPLGQIPGSSVYEANRIGITASRKVGNAVVRNLFKRRIREWFRRRREDLGVERDFVVIARRSGAKMSLRELDLCLSDLLKLSPSPHWTPDS